MDPNSHPNIPKSELPPCLHRPLVFGDREQIDALDALGDKIKEERKALVRTCIRTANLLSLIDAEDDVS